MFQPANQGAQASTLSPATGADTPQFESVRHLLFGSPVAVRRIIALLHKLNYAEPNDWSKKVLNGFPKSIGFLLAIQWCIPAAPITKK